VLHHHFQAVNLLRGLQAVLLQAVTVLDTLGMNSMLRMLLRVMFGAQHVVKRRALREALRE
jgi:hypothetical protein